MKAKARRDFLKLASAGVADAMTVPIPGAVAEDIGVRGMSTKSALHNAGTFEVMAYGAAGDGTTIDTPAINSAIEAAAASGGGTVHFAAGQYLCYSVRLKSDVSLHLDQGAVIIAADPLPERQVFVLQNVEDADFSHIKTPAGAPVIELRDCNGVNALWVRGIKDGPAIQSESRHSSHQP